MRALILKWDRFYCQTLASLGIRIFGPMEVVITQRAREALRLLAAAPTTIALMGVDAPDLDGLDFIPDVMKSGMCDCTVILCERGDSRTLSALRRLPFAGLIDSTTADLAELQTAFNEIAHGRRYMSPSFRARFRGPEFPWYSNLSTHEEVVFAVLAEGLDNEAAAARLGLSSETVRSHRTRIMSKLGVHHKGELIAYALANRYVRYTNLGILHPGLERALESMPLVKAGPT